MYYRLSESYLLRGWQHMTNVLVRRPYNIIQQLSGKDFNLLLLCDGCTDFESLIRDEEKTTLASYVEKGVVTPCEEKTPLSPDQKYILYKNRYVRTAFWSITGRCNYRCRHCYMDAPDAQLGEVSHEEAMDFIDQIHACGIFNVDITGGEPFVRKDFWQLVDHMLGYKIRINQVYTNGWLLTEKVLDEFEARGQKPEFSISFDGVGWHDWLRRVDGAEDAAIRALKMCKRRGFPVNVEMCVHKGNVGTIRETIKLLAECGVHAIKLGPVHNSELWCANCDGNAISLEEFIEATIDYIPHYFEDGCPMSALFGGVVSLTKKGYAVTSERYCGDASCEDNFLCGAVRSSCYITPEGRVLPCLPMTSWDGQYDYPRIQDEGLQKLLTSGFYMDVATARVRDLLKINEKCAACEYKYLCGGGCRASAAMSCGDVMGSDPDQCLFFRGGYPARIRETAEKAMKDFPVEK